MDIVARFAQEYLKDKYEAVYAVHNDKSICMGILFLIASVLKRG